MVDILSMTEEELVAFINRNDEGKTTVTYENGGSEELNIHEAIARKQLLLMREDVEFGF